MEQQYNPVEFIGPIGTLCDGYAHYNRALIRTLNKYGCPLKLTSAELGNNPAVPICNDKDIIDLIKSSKDLVSPNVLISGTVPPLYRKGSGINIGITTWETTRVLTEWIQAINNMTALIVPSLAVEQTFLREGVRVPILVCKYPIDFDKINNLSPIIIEPTVKRRVTFLFNGNWIPRKNMEDLIYAYIEAFNGVGDVVLLIKTWATNNDVTSRQHIDNAVRHLASKMNGFNRPKIIVSTEPVTDEQNLQIIKGADVIVSTSHGEGCDASVAYGLAMNKYVICDRFMGHSDYTDRKVINYSHTLRPVLDSGVAFYGPSMKWAKPDYESLVEAYKQAYGKAIKDNTPDNHQIKLTNSDRVIFDNVINFLNTLISKHEKAMAPVSR